jgi:hypothetical protein
MMVVLDSDEHAVDLDLACVPELTQTRGNSQGE